jgi:hypothetical protein
MTKVDQPRRVRPPLPRLVDQLRVLLWMQMHLSLLGAVVATFAVVIVDRYNQNDLSGNPAREALERRLELGLLLLAAATVLLAICAPLVRRRWPPIHLLSLATEAIVVVVIVDAARSGVAPVLFGILYAALTVWILADLFRGEVLRHLYRIGR